MCLAALSGSKNSWRRRSLGALPLLGILLASCTGAVSDPLADLGRGDGPLADLARQDSRRQDSGRTDTSKPRPDKGSPPFSCKLPAATPTLKPRHWLHPKAPHAGQTATLSLQSRIKPKPSSPHKLTATVVNRDGTRSTSTYDAAGGEYWIYHIPLVKLARGQNCVVLRRGSSVELALKITAPAPAKLPRGGGVWQVVKNHQWRCDEQPKYGNWLRVKVLDQGGKPVKGARVNIAWTDDTQYPVKPDKGATSWAQHRHPKQLTTGADGKASLSTPWGSGIRTPIDAKPGYLMFLLTVAGGASDTAMEITSGLWETTNAGCNYCGKYGVNVYGHWSYSVEFRRNPKASQVCEVPTDHAGQTKCGARHLYHDPKVKSCRPVG